MKSQYMPVVVLQPASLPLLLPGSGVLARAHFSKEVSQTAFPTRKHSHQLPAAVPCLTPVQKHMKLPGRWHQGIDQVKASQKKKCFLTDPLPSLAGSAGAERG